MCAAMLDRLVHCFWMHATLAKSSPSDPAGPRCQLLPFAQAGLFILRLSSTPKLSFRPLELSAFDVIWSVGPLELLEGGAEP